MDLVWKEATSPNPDLESHWILWERMERGSNQNARQHAKIVASTTRDENGNWITLSMIGHPVPEGAKLVFDDLDAAREAGMAYATA